MFSLAKCWPLNAETAAADPDCGADAFFYTYEVKVIATLNDGEGTFDDSITFSVTFGPDCSQDFVYFEKLYESPQIHYITSPPTTDTYDHVLR